MNNLVKGMFKSELRYNFYKILNKYKSYEQPYEVTFFTDSFYSAIFIFDERFLAHIRKLRKNDKYRGKTIELYVDYYVAKFLGINLFSAWDKSFQIIDMKKL